MLEKAQSTFCLLTQCVENYWTEFHQAFTFDAFWDKDKRFKFWGQKVKGQGHSVTRGPVGRRIRTRCCVSSSNFWFFWLNIVTFSLSM